MSRPSATDQLLGARRTGVVIGCLVVGSIYYCALRAEQHAPAPWLLPIVLVLLGRQARLARQRLAAFDGWDRRWRQMSGEAEQPIAAKRKARPALLVTTGVAWLLTGYWLSTNADANSSAYGAFCLSFVGLGAWGAGAALLSLGRRVFRRGERRAAAKAAPREHIVSVCVRRPWASPSPRQIAAALPEHARALLARKAEPSTAPSGEAQQAPSRSH